MLKGGNMGKSDKELMWVALTWLLVLFSFGCIINSNDRKACRDLQHEYGMQMVGNCEGAGLDE